MSEATFDSDKLESLLSEAAERCDVPGATIGLYANGEFSHANFGVLNADTKEPVKDDSLFQIGSITKVLTAQLVITLADQGKIELDKPLREYVPEFRVDDLEASNTVTVRQLLNHTSGLAGDFMVDTGTPPGELERYLQCCRLLPLNHRVGEGLSYSNAAYCLAGLLVERITGKSFYRAMEEMLFEPLGLSNSLVDHQQIPWERASSGHSPDPDEPNRMKVLDTIHGLPTCTAPAGATVMMTIKDLVDFARFHLGNGMGPDGHQVLSPEMIAEMQNPCVTIPVPQRNISRWGLGWFILDHGDQMLFGHDGATLGQASYLRVHKESGTVIALLTNGGRGNDCMVELFDTILGALIGCVHAVPPDPVEDEALDLSRFAGRFENIAFKTDFWVEDGVLCREAKGILNDLVIPEPKSELSYCGNDKFLNTVGKGRPAVISFHDFDEEGIPQTMFYGLRIARRVNPL